MYEIFTCLQFLCQSIRSNNFPYQLILSLERQQLLALQHSLVQLVFHPRLHILLWLWTTKFFLLIPYNIFHLFLSSLHRNQLVPLLLHRIQEFLCQKRTFNIKRFKVVQPQFTMTIWEPLMSNFTNVTFSACDITLAGTLSIFVTSGISILNTFHITSTSYENIIENYFW